MDGTPSPSDQGLSVSGPIECEHFISVVGPSSGVTDMEAGVSPEAPPQKVGSFEERCSICMDVAAQASRLWQANDSTAQTSSALCAAAAAATETDLLPTVRTCRMHQPSCAGIVEESQAFACSGTWELLRHGASLSTVRTAQQRACGALMTQRNGSGVDDALVCPQPRDVGARIMGIAAVVATTIFAAQYAL